MTLTHRASPNSNIFTLHSLSFLMCLCSIVFEGCNIPKPVKETITRQVGCAVLLPCSCTELQLKLDRFQWTFRNNKLYSEVIGNWTKEDRERYSGRVMTFSATSPGNASLLLSNLTEEDQGEYTCLIFTNHNTAERSISLIVNGK